MQCANLSTSDFSHEVKSVGIHLKTFSGSGKYEPKNLVCQQLLVASKDTGMLIVCLLELNSITSASLRQIWERFISAIEEAQCVLQAEHPDGPSEPSSL